MRIEFKNAIQRLTLQCVCGGRGVGGVADGCGQWIWLTRCMQSCMQHNHDISYTMQEGINTLQF